MCTSVLTKVGHFSKIWFESTYIWSIGNIDGKVQNSLLIYVYVWLLYGYDHEYN